MKFLKLIRFSNLLIIAITQYLLRYCIIKPVIDAGEFEFQMSHFEFGLIVLSTCLIAAAGYIINDYFDVSIDHVNRPNTNYIGFGIKRRWAMAFHFIFNILAFLFSFYVSYSIGNYKLTFIFLLAAGALWYYSTIFKKQFLLGNLVVALLTAMVPFIVGIYDIPLLNARYALALISIDGNFNNLSYIILGFTFFAFIISMIRETIKDCEDVIGDREFGSETLPIRWGLRKTDFYIAALNLITIITLIYFQKLQWLAGDKVSVMYLLLGVQLPLLFVTLNVLVSRDNKKYAFASRALKIIMLIGTLYSVLFYYLITR